MLFTTTLLCGHGPHGSGLVAIYWASSTFGWTTQTDGDGDGIGELETDGGMWRSDPTGLQSRLV